MPATAIAEYLKAYESDPRFTLAVGKLLESTLQDPGAAKDLVHRLWRVNPRQANIDLLRKRLQGVDSPDDVRAIVSRFLANGGD